MSWFKVDTADIFEYLVERDRRQCLAESTGNIASSTASAIVNVYKLLANTVVIGAFM